MGKNHGRVYNHTVRRSEATNRHSRDAGAIPAHKSGGWLEHIREQGHRDPSRWPCDVTPLDSLRWSTTCKSPPPTPVGGADGALAELRVHDDGTLVVLHKPSGFRCCRPALLKEQWCLP